MRKLLLRCALSPGDIVMLTAAVRDLHQCYPGEFATDVRTSCPEFWEHNPYLTALAEGDPDVTKLDCTYPLIDRCNQAPYHCLHGFVEFLNGQLGLQIKPTRFGGDLHLSRPETAWVSQIQELTKTEIPFWIIGAGGKYDITIKWWATERYQEVVDHFRGRVQFVQVGAVGHHHPKLDGVIDLRGRTTLRELVRLVYHSQGTVCGVTALMHLAAAVPPKRKDHGARPCVVIAGGREPAHWEAYPEHQFMSTAGSLPCCIGGGCWKDRVRPLGDGDERDRIDHLCTNVAGNLPGCMDLILPADVIRRIEGYFQGGRFTFLTAAQGRVARRASLASKANDFDQSPLNLHSARFALEQFASKIPASPSGFVGRGVVICGGGANYFTNAWVLINMLRHHRCTLPIELWHLGRAEMDFFMQSLVKPLGVECVDARKCAQRSHARRLGGWELKPYAMIHSQFREVLFLDADNVPVRNPEFLFDTRPYRETGALFWPDYGRMKKTDVIWTSCGLPRPPGAEFESGQMVVDKERCWEPLRLALWFNEHSDFYYQYLHGDKETFHLAFHKLRKSYGFVEKPPEPLLGTMCQHDFEGNRLFQHRNTDKWSLWNRNTVVDDFWFEPQCREFLGNLERIWDPRKSPVLRRATRKLLPAGGVGRTLSIAACMISCPERVAVRRKTLRNLASTDWGEEPAVVQVDSGGAKSKGERQTKTAWLALQKCLSLNVNYVLFLEDDLDFNRYLRHNLSRWPPLLDGEVTLASLYNPGVAIESRDPARRSVVVAPEVVFGSQAFLISRATVRHIVDRWDQVPGMQDIKMSRLAGRLQRPLVYHSPSLVQHLGKKSTWGGWYHTASDFDPCWRV